MSAQALLDLTALPRPQRHRLVIAALEVLRDGASLVIVNDHEPNGLRLQLERRYAERLHWEVHERADGRVTVAIRLDDPPRRDSVAPGEGSAPFPTAA